MTLMQWTPQLESGLDPMDATHREFVEHYNALAQATPDELLVRLDEFIAHTEAHFDQENRWMEAVGFPGCHRAEHDRVLAVAGEVRKRLAGGDAALAGQLVQELPPWFEMHVNGMDAALAHYLTSIGFDFASGTVPGREGGCGDASPGSCTCTGAAA